MFFFVVWAGVAIITGLAAQARGRSFPGWLILGMLFSLLALLAVLVMENLKLSRAAVAAAPSPQPLPQSAEIRQVKVYKGVPIMRGPDGVTVDGQVFENVLAAERHIDARATGV